MNYLISHRCVGYLPFISAAFLPIRPYAQVAIARMKQSIPEIATPSAPFSAVMLWKYGSISALGTESPERLTGLADWAFVTRTNGPVIER